MLVDTLFILRYREPGRIGVVEGFIEAQGVQKAIELGRKYCAHGRIYVGVKPAILISDAPSNPGGNTLEQKTSENSTPKRRGNPNWIKRQKS